jgi:hypothetical protein
MPSSFSKLKPQNERSGSPCPTISLPGSKPSWPPASPTPQPAAPGAERIRFFCSNKGRKSQDATADLTKMQPQPAASYQAGLGEHKPHPGSPRRERNLRYCCLRGEFRKARCPQLALRSSCENNFEESLIDAEEPPQQPRRLPLQHSPHTCGRPQCSPSRIPRLRCHQTNSNSCKEDQYVRQYLFCLFHPGDSLFLCSRLLV